MLLAVQLPVVDVRPLLAVDTWRHEQPAFPLPDRVYARHTPDHHRANFVAGLGPVRPRLRGRGNAPWPSESYYVDVRRRIVQTRETYTVWGRRQTVRPVYRNFYTDGVVGRLELGFQAALKDQRSEAVLPPLTDRILTSLVRLATPTLGDAGPVPLVHFGRRFAHYLLACTTDRGRGKTEPWWLTAGAPAVIAEVSGDEEQYVITPEGGYEAPGALEHRWRTVSGVRVATWTLRQGDSTADEFRRLRVHVSRLHSDFAAFDAVLSMCAAGRLDATYPPVEAYLTRTADLLTRTKRHGFAQLELLTYVVGAAQSAYQETLAALDLLGGQIGSQELASRLELMHTVLDQSTQLHFQIGELVMAKYETNISGGQQGIVHGGTGDVHARDVTVGGQDLTPLVTALTEAVSELRAALPPDTALTAEDTAEGVRRELELPEAERDKERLGDRLRRLFGIANDAGVAGTALAGAVTAIRAALGF